ncbi:MAG: putative repeat protein (TIGR01451 family) [Crocinitomicaceae bacterium]|jgi:uncharacterized repeat protein (TIGR01451 family)
MKFLATLLLAFSAVCLAFGQSVSMSPNVGYQGQTSPTPLPVTISGVGTSFDQGSQSLVDISQGLISLDYTSDYISSNYMTGFIDIPVNAVPGYYNVLVGDVGSQLPVPGGFLVLPGNGHNVFGRVILDINENCTDDVTELGVEGINVLINPLGVIVQTGPGGYWSLPSLAVGSYELVVGGTGSWTPTCPPTQSFTVANSSLLTLAPAFGMVNTNPCPDPIVSVFAPFLRRCFSNQRVYVSACNGNMGTGSIMGAYVDLELDAFMQPLSSSIPYTALGSNTYRFDIGDLDPGNCVDFWVSTQISCSALLSQSLCMRAELYPVDPCTLDTIPANQIPPGTDPAFQLPVPCALPWDNSSLSVNGWCQDDEVHFSITNTGDLGGGDMQCYSPTFLYVNDTLIAIDSIQLVGQETINYTFPANGETWIMAVDQHPLHPGNSHPNDHVEACGSTIVNWIPGMVNNIPQDDADPVVDIYCGEVTGSYDPNDKRGFPTGLTEDHLVLPNTQLEYYIRFQNTGTDTAFNIVVRDTLDFDLDIFSVKSTVSSNDYTFRVYGPRVLEWTFSNIMLPDSTTDEPGSHGFLTYNVKQLQNLSNGTMITNSAAIYFDFNDPIITNETWHEVDDMLQSSPVGTIITIIPVEDQELELYPNPTLTNMFLDNSIDLVGAEYVIADMKGNIVLRGILEYQHNDLNMKELPAGMYVIRINNSSPTRIMKM